MGAWNTGIFGNDVAVDVRIEFRRAIDDGKSATAARQAVLKTWAPALKDPDDGPIVWMALAATQIERKCLEKQVRDKALRILDAGGDLERWREAGAKKFGARKAALERLRSRLAKAKPAAKSVVAAKAKPKKRFVELKKNFPLGEVFAYRMTSGKYVLLHVVDYSGNRDYGFHPVFAVLDWQLDQLPSADGARQIPLKRVNDDYRGPNWPFMIEIFRQKQQELPADRVVRLNVIREMHCMKVDGGYTVTHWSTLEKSLDYCLGWK
jgi:hypothetical protein